MLSKPTFADEVSHLPTGMAIGDLVKRVQLGVICLDNPLQRHVVWSLRHRETFIDSLFKRYAIHAIILVKKSSTCFDCIDGKQRLTTLVEFCTNKFSYLGCLYKDLDETTRRELDYTQLPVITYESEMSRARIEEMFSRIQDGVKVSIGELINARQESPIVAGIMDVLDTVAQESPEAFGYIARRQRMSEVKLLFSLYWFLSGRSLEGLTMKTIDILTSKKANKDILQLVSTSFREVMSHIELLNQEYEIPSLKQENMVYICLVKLLDRANSNERPKLTNRNLVALLEATKAKLRDVFKECTGLKAKTKKQLNEVIRKELSL